MTPARLLQSERNYRKDIADAAREVAHAARYDGPMKELVRLTRDLVAANNRLGRFLEDNDIVLALARISPTARRAR